MVKMMEDKLLLLSHLDAIHTTALGVSRIKSNLELSNVDVVAWCKDAICKADAKFKRIGKNWYVETCGVILTINAFRYTIITAHKKA